ncbi:CBS domain containing protein [Syntrophobotulus glycolicus DSM 8271]|uniref:CBS domain containing protein n=1 Tax=Syntrophobotulus glycolicus (strain DSM 8271 / FlGlyR) TaxID=645991 RepID=F0T2R4_SYNGF|nr:CBS domain-containing protein [Syntrophobotulus glycolicus]ADY56463.1 CBS domain containing protein [Syntrophobotulus glycolicus DSM 8271]
MSVSEIMSARIFSADQNSSLSDIAKIMKEQDIGAVPVCEGDRLLGIITDRDIIVRAVSEKKDLQKTLARQVMTLDPICIEEKDSISQAADLMAEYQVKRLPVLKSGKLVGIITLGDLAIEHLNTDQADAMSGIARGITH